jgi:hypothetical protein
MTFPCHKYAGGALHLFIGAVLLWLLSLLLAAVGWDVPVWLAVVVAYGSVTSGSRLGGFPDTASWLVNFLIPSVGRWEVYTRAHVGDLYHRFKWIPAWWLHIFCDKFAHAPKDANGIPLPPKWWEMNLAWKEKSLIFGLTLWDAQYVWREAALWVLASFFLVAGARMILSVARIVITVTP